MRVGDYFKINMPRSEGTEIVYQAIVLSSDQEWVSAQVVHPTSLARKLQSQGVFKLHLHTLSISILGNPEDSSPIKAIYG